MILAYYSTWIVVIMVQRGIETVERREEITSQVTERKQRMIPGGVTRIQVPQNCPQ